MNRTLHLIITITVAIPFGYSLAQVEPYPNTHGLQVLIVCATLFVIIGALLGESKAKSFWLLYGVATVACFAISYFWFWFGAMSRGWWYPQQPRIVQQFFFVDGEGGYDAMVANLFLVLWLLASAVFAIRYLTRRSRGRAASGAALS